MKSQIAKYTLKELTLEKNLMHALSALESLHTRQIVLNILELTMGNDPTNALCVTRSLSGVVI